MAIISAAPGRRFTRPDRKDPRSLGTKEPIQVLGHDLARSTPIGAQVSVGGPDTRNPIGGSSPWDLQR